MVGTSESSFIRALEECICNARKGTVDQFTLLFFCCSFSLIRDVFLSNNYYVWFFRQSATINPTTFSCPFKEWKFCQYEVNPLEGMDWMKCPCSINQHSCYVDGNMELYHYCSFGRSVVLDKLQFSF